MPHRPYTQLCPEKIDDNITFLSASSRIDQVGLPILFIASGKLMLVGRLKERRLNLASTCYPLIEGFSRDELQAYVQDHADFAFTKEAPIKRVKYPGLVRHKQSDRSFIVPVIARLDEPFDAPELQPSPEWVQHAEDSPDRVWVDTAGMTDVLAKGMVTANTAAIIRFAFMGPAKQLI